VAQGSICEKSFAFNKTVKIPRHPSGIAVIARDRNVIAVIGKAKTDSSGDPGSGDRKCKLIGQDARDRRDRKPRGLTAENAEIAEELGWCERGKKTSHRHGRKGRNGKSVGGVLKRRLSFLERYPFF